MDSKCTNLLPLERQRALVRSYALRLGTVVIVLVIVFTCSAALLLVPTYVFLMKSAAAKETHLANIELVLSPVDEKALAAHLAALSRNTALLIALGSTPSSSVIIRNALAIPRPGITLSNVVYMPAVQKSSGTLVISGTAATREALRGYQIALENSSFAVSASVPVSVYAKDIDIAFTITVILAP